MNSRREPRRRRGPWAAVTILVAAGAASAQTDPTPWTHYPAADCSVAQTGIELACGDQGTFVLDAQGPAPGCALEAAEHIKRYGQPKGFVSKVIDQPLIERPDDWEQTTTGAVSQTHGRARAAVGSQTKQAPEPNDTWSALIDWNTWHGLSIAWIIQDMAPDSRLLFLDLESPALDPLGEGISDAHVLAKLCQVRDLVDRGVAPPPRLVNLSLGRYATEPETLNGGRCDGHRLSCWVTRLIESMVADGTVVAAAAGNHRSMLFPAAIEATVSVAALDLTAFEQQRIAMPAWESPEGARALFAADNLCLRGGWFAPAGTSFSTAVFSGWMLAALRDNPGLDPTSVQNWTPVELPSGCLSLAADDVPLHGCKTEISAFMDFVLSPNNPLSPCNAPPTDDSVVLMVPTPVGPVAPPRFESFDRWFAGLAASSKAKRFGDGRSANTRGEPGDHRPAPETDFCIPCMGGGGGGHGALVDVETKAQAHVTPTDLVLDLSDSPTTAGHVDTIYLRTGQGFYRLDLDDQALKALDRGGVDRLVIEKGQLLVELDRQASLVPVIRTEQDMRCDDVANGSYTGPGRCFWSASPIFIDD